jgi:integrase/recombinase XerC
MGLLPYSPILTVSSLTTFTNSLTQRVTLSELADRDDDILADFLELKVSPNTRRTYAKALDDFFTRLTGSKATPLMVGEFLNLSQKQAIILVLKYQSMLVDAGLTPSTVNVRLSAIKSIVSHARKLGRCGFSLGDVRSMGVEVYRDTSGVDADGIGAILNTCDRASARDKRDRSEIKGCRDYAILRLLWGNALRRGEVSATNVGDFSPSESKLWIRGKGKLVKIAIDLAPKTTAAIEEWLDMRSVILGVPQPTDPLFIGLGNSQHVRLLGEGIRLMVVDRTKQAGIGKVMSPHRVRHSAITAYLDASGGDVRSRLSRALARSAQGLSRHANLNTLTRYDDNRHRYQAKASGVLEDLV